MPMREVTGAWQQWIAENIMRGVPEQTLIGVMIERGTPGGVAESAIEAARASIRQTLEGQRALLEKYQAQLENYHRLFSLGGDVRVPKIEGLSREDFLKQYYASNRAAVITGLLCGSKVKEWTPISLRERCGREVVEVQVERRSEPIWDVFLAGKSRRILFSEYVDLVLSAGSTNEFYLTGNDGFLSRPKMKTLMNEADYAGEYLDHSDADRNMHLWLGPEGVVSPLHRDRVNVLMAQIYGCKRILLAHSSQLASVYNERSFYSNVNAESPNYEKFPLFKNVDLYEVTLQPGECLFIPVGWWHHVRSLGVTVSITATNFVYPNDFL